MSKAKTSLTVLKLEIIDQDPQSVPAVLSQAVQAHKDYTDVMVVGFDADGNVVVNSSNMTRPEQVWLLMSAIELVRSSDES